jgi:tetratricopeptide (TPR) repeat protein
MNDNKDVLEEARAASHEKDYPKALEICSVFIEAHPDSPDGFRTRSDVYGLMGDFVHAILDRTAALKRDRGSPDDFFFRGWWNLEINELDAALDDLTRALRTGEKSGIHHFDEIAFFFRSLTYLRLGRYDEALADAQNVRDDFLMHIRSGQVSKAQVVREANSKKATL